MIRVAFYKAKGNWLDWIIRKWTKGPYSHCELVTGDLWLSASPREKVVRYKAIKPGQDEWDFVSIDLNTLQIERLQDWAALELGSEYDWLGILLTQTINLNRQDPHRWFCSELVTAALQQAGMLAGITPHQTDPNELYALLTTPRRA
jgi:hypothetical protein